MESERAQLIELIEQQYIPAEKIDGVLAATGIVPDGKAWMRFIDHLLLWLGGLALSFAAMFFVAHNWDDLGRFAKFGMNEALIAVAVLGYCKLDQDKVAAKVALLMATLLLGVLLALYGQTYQTGADSWQLFFNWALLMLPWAIIGRFSAIWILWLALLNLSIVLYYMTFRGAVWFLLGSDTSMLWLLFALNTLALGAWEVLSNRWHWLAERWAVRLLGICSGVAVTWLVLFAIFDHRQVGGWSGLLWLGWLAGIYYVYRYLRCDLFMLAGLALSGSVVVVGFVSKHILHSLDAGGFLFVALLLITLGTSAALWLRNIHREWQS